MYSILDDILIIYLIYLAVSFMRHYKSYSVHILSFKHFQNGELHVQSQLMTVFQYYQKGLKHCNKGDEGQAQPKSRSLLAFALTEFFIFNYNRSSLY